MPSFMEATEFAKWANEILHAFSAERMALYSRENSSTFNLKTDFEFFLVF